MYERIRPEDIDIRGAHNLVRGIVEQAAHDWRAGVEMEKKTREMSHTRVACETFFKSKLFESLTGLNGEYVLRRLRREG